MEIIEEDDGEIKQLMLRISNKEITLCETCYTFFDYVPQVKACDECKKKKQREYNQRTEVKAKKREYDIERRHLPEVKAKKRERERTPEYKAKAREYRQRPEVKERIREYSQRPEVKAKKRERDRTPEYKAKAREYNQRPEVKAKVRERKERNKKPTQRQPSQKRRRVVAALDSRERMKKAMQNLGMTEEMRLYFEEWFLTRWI